MTDYTAYDQGLPCRNPACASHGQSHPNCKCYAGGHRSGYSEYAHGGHVEGCPHYAEGGDVQSPPQDDLPNTLGMHAADSGLLGMLTRTGHSRLSDPDAHHAKIHAFQRNGEESFHGHPLASGVSKKHLEPIMQRLGPIMNTQDSHPDGTASAISYLHSAMKGHDALDSHMGKTFGSEKLDVGDDKESTEELKNHLEDLQENPSKMLDIGGHLGALLPEHATHLAAQSAIAVNYLQSLKPKTQQLAPLDTKESVDKMAEAAYTRQVSLAQHPLKTLSFVKNGTLLPADITTIQTIYPGLYKSMINKAGEQLIEAKTKGKEIPYKQKQSLSLLLGQPLDFTQSQPAMAAILMANAPSGIHAETPQKKGDTSKATGVELKQINKVDEMFETPLEARQINRNKH